MSGSKRVCSRLPVIGSVLFILLYLIAAILYPGGYTENEHACGFSWLHNYWCNLLNAVAIDGKMNPGRPFALLGNFVLSFTMCSFYWQFPKLFQISKSTKLSIQFSGILSMCIAFLLFTSIDHDLLTNLASFFGLIATLGTLLVLYKYKQRAFFYGGIIVLFMVLLNLIFYHSPSLIVFLPLIQKITFLLFLSWISWICLYFSKARSA